MSLRNVSAAVGQRFECAPERNTALACSR